MIANTLFYEPMHDVAFVSGARFVSSGEQHAFSSTAKYIFDEAYKDCFTLKDANFPMCEYIGADAFRACKKLSQAVFPNASYIGMFAFSDMGRDLSYHAEVSFPECLEIDSGAFYYANISTVSFPKVSKIRSSAFMHTDVSFISLPACTLLGEACFDSCINLTAITPDNLPELLIIHNYAFAWNINLSYVYLSKVYNIGGYIFRDCTNLISVDMPELSTILGTFYDCSNLRSVSLPKCLSVYNYTFQGAGISYVDLPMCNLVGQRAFYRAGSLKAVSIPVCQEISNYAFNDCTQLQSIYLTAVSSVTSLGNSVFYNPNTGVRNYCDVYVPMSLVSDFQAAPNWAQSEIASRIIGV